MDLDRAAHPPSALEYCLKAINEHYPSGYESTTIREVGNLVIRLMRRFAEEEPLTRADMARQDYTSIKANRVYCDLAHAHAAKVEYEVASTFILYQIDRLVDTYRLTCDVSSILWHVKIMA